MKEETLTIKKTVYEENIIFLLLRFELMIDNNINWQYIEINLELKRKAQNDYSELMKKQVILHELKE